jgi:hypothetical protein
MTLDIDLNPTDLVLAHEYIKQRLNVNLDPNVQDRVTSSLYTRYNHEKQATTFCYCNIRLAELSDSAFTYTFNQSDLKDGVITPFKQMMRHVGQALEAQRNKTIILLCAGGFNYIGEDHRKLFKKYNIDERYNLVDIPQFIVQLDKSSSDKITLELSFLYKKNHIAPNQSFAITAKGLHKNLNKVSYLPLIFTYNLSSSFLEDTCRELIKDITRYTFLYQIQGDWYKTEMDNNYKVQIHFIVGPGVVLPYLTTVHSLSRSDEVQGKLVRKVFHEKCVEDLSAKYAKLFPFNLDIVVDITVKSNWDCIAYLSV